MADFLSGVRTPTSPSPSPEPADGLVPKTTTGQTEAEGGAGVGAAFASSSSSTAHGLNSSTLTDTSSDHFASSSVAANIGSSSLGAPSSNLQQQQQQQSQDQSEIAREVLEEKIRIGVDDLMQLAMCAGDVQPGDEDIVKMKINETMGSLQAIQDATNLTDLNQMVPEDVMGMIDQGRNPDIHTRTFTNRLNGDNQQMRGQANNFDRYRSRLRAKIEAAFPEMKAELEAMDTV